jgi:hypothetical protein
MTKPFASVLTGPNHPRLVACLLVALAALSVLYLGKGFLWAVGVDGGAKDLNLRWLEQTYVCAGLNPYDFPNAAAVKSALSHAPSLSEVQRAVLQQIGPSVEGLGYPPWSFAINMAIAPCAPWGFVRHWYAALSVVSLAVMSFWAYHICVPWGLQGGMLGAASCLAMGAVSSTLSNGQLGLIVTAQVRLSVQATRRAPIRV